MEKDLEIGEKAPTRKTISANLNLNLANLMKEENIGWTKALEFGGQFLLAIEREDIDYPDNPLLTKIRTLQEHIIKLQSKDVEKEAEEILKRKGVIPEKP